MYMYATLIRTYVTYEYVRVEHISPFRRPPQAAPLASHDKTIRSSAMRCRSSYPLAAAALTAVSMTRRSGAQAFSPLRTIRADTCIRRQASTDVLASENATSALPDSHRVFVGNLSPDICREEHVLRDSFGRFGDVVDITLHGFWKRSVDEETAATQKKRSNVRPYAFVTFAEASSAAAALAEWGVEAVGSRTPPSISGCVVKSAVKRKPRPKSNKRKARAEEREELVDYLSREANVVLQCPKSHMQRLSDYLQYFDGVEVLSSLDPGKRAVTLLFVKSKDPAVLANRLLSVPYAAIAVNNMYILDGDVINEGTLDEDVAKMALKKLASLRRRLDQSDDSNDIVVRVQAFPPKIRSRFIVRIFMYMLLAIYITLEEDPCVQSSHWCRPHACKVRSLPLYYYRYM